MPTARSKRVLTNQDIVNGKGYHDLNSSDPDDFLTIGGMLAVVLFQNRTATKDIDFLLDPNVDAVEEYRNEVLRVIRGVGRRQGFNEDWMNDDMKIFIDRSQRDNLFLQSIEQGIVVFQGQCLTVYAAHLEFALELKLRRVDQQSNETWRAVDLSDAVTLMHYLKGNRNPLSRQDLRKLDKNNLGVMVGNAGIQAKKIMSTR